MYRKFAFVLIIQGSLSLAIGACSSAESTEGTTARRSSATPVARAESKAAGPSSDVVSQLIQQALRAEGSVSHQTLVRRLGAPQRVETRPIANQYVRGQMDTVRTLIYPGIEALVYDVAHQEKSFLVRLSLSSPQYTTPEGVRVGIVERDVIEKIGPPTRRNPTEGELIYQETGTPSTSLVVRVEANRVVRIDWEFSFT